MIALVLLLSLAQTNGPDGKGIGFQQDGSTVFGYRQPIATANAARTLVRPGTAGVPACVPFGSRLVLGAAGGGAVVHFSMTSTLTFAGALSTRLGCSMVDANGPEGQGSCLALPASGIVVYEALTFDQFYRAPGARGGVCSGWVNCMGTSSRIGCRVDGDCTEAGAGSTCDTTSSAGSREQILRNYGAGFLVFQVDTANAVLTVARQK